MTLYMFRANDREGVFLGGNQDNEYFRNNVVVIPSGYFVLMYGSTFLVPDEIRHEQACGNRWEPGYMHAWCMNSECVSQAVVHDPINNNERRVTDMPYVRVVSPYDLMDVMFAVQDEFDWDSIQ